MEPPETPSLSQRYIWSAAYLIDFHQTFGSNDFDKDMGAKTMSRHIVSSLARGSDPGRVDWHVGTQVQPWTAKNEKNPTINQIQPAIVRSDRKQLCLSNCIPAMAAILDISLTFQLPEKSNHNLGSFGCTYSHSYGVPMYHYC